MAFRGVPSARHVIAIGFLLSAAVSTAFAFEVTEARAPCEHRDPLLRPLFGDLHVHTS